MFEFLSSSFVSICSKFISRNQFFFTQMWDVPGIFKEKLDVVEKSWIKTEFAGEPSNLIHLQGTRFFRKLPLQIPNQFWSIFSRKHSKSYLRYSWRTSGMRVLWHQRCLHHQRRNSTTQRNTFGTQKKGIKGRILTTDYNLFSEPEARKELAKFDNIDVRMHRCQEGSGFHVKSYIFNHPSQCNLIVRSSNLPQYAWTTNQEWNVKLVSTFEGEMVFLIKKEFEKLWNDPPPSIPLEEVIEEYERERVKLTLLLLLSSI